MPVLTISHHSAGHKVAQIVIGIKGIRDQYNPSHPHLHWIMDLKAIGVQCQQPHWYHQSQTGQKAPSISNVADDVGRLDPT